MSILEEQNTLPFSEQESPENYLYFLTTVNPTDFINTSERGSKIVKLFSEHFLPLPFSSNEDGSDLTEETTVILLVPYFIALGTLQIRQENTQPFNMELHQKNRKIQLKQANEYFCKFLNLALQYDQVNDDYLSWVLPHTMNRDDDEEEQVAKSTKKQDKAFEQLMNDRSQMVLRMKTKNALAQELFSNVEEMSELEISRLLSSVSLGEDSSKKVSEQVKKKMLNIRDYINFCVLDTLENLASNSREEGMLNAVSARPSMPQHPSQSYQQQSGSTSGQPISHLKATSINDVLNNRGVLSQMGYNMILLPNNNGGNTGNKSTSSGNSLQKKALANQSIQSNIINNRTTREDIKSRVFGSYVPGPTVSLEEFARQECIDMHQREEKDKQFKQEQTQKKKDDEEEEDEEELKKKRVWEDWKDDHVKGSGNMRD
ncbi:predicted protein [Naegleria gruberi]|uniref:Predicted protein n=1 Tax=Naegleria gruberi TaxID=5762 RepID=D2UZC4_NAEGR|nr:uncharacterized protein NAEGRDRAFT_61888 [Naegleria gruberi]EFC49923.1 predicted protein [Naegleria gruberi]|eukprot:XP_002682667.1 predicted protein [Naegleria gruberi strain NEG-M]